METKTTYQFSIETTSNTWKMSPEYATQEDCFAAALRCKKALNKRFQRITFIDNVVVVAKGQ